MMNGSPYPLFPVLRGMAWSPSNGSSPNRLLKNAHLRRSPHPSSLQRTFKYASLLRISGALHLGIFDQPEKNEFFNRLPSFNKAETLSIHYIHTDLVWLKSARIVPAIMPCNNLCNYNILKAFSQTWSPNLTERVFHFLKNIFSNDSKTISLGM